MHFDVSFSLSFSSVLEHQLIFYNCWNFNYVQYWTIFDLSPLLNKNSKDFNLCTNQKCRNYIYAAKQKRYRILTLFLYFCLRAYIVMDVLKLDESSPMNFEPSSFLKHWRVAENHHPRQTVSLAGDSLSRSVINVVDIPFCNPDLNYVFI